MRYTTINHDTDLPGKAFLQWASKQHALGRMTFTKQAGVLRLVADHVITSQMGFGLTGLVPVLGLQQEAFVAVSAVDWNDADVFEGEYLYLTTPMIAEPAEMHMDAVPVQLWLPVNPTSVAGIMKVAIKKAARLDIELMAIQSGKPVVSASPSGTISIPHQDR